MIHNCETKNIIYFIIYGSSAFFMCMLLYLYNLKQRKFSSLSCPWPLAPTLITGHINNSSSSYFSLKFLNRSLRSPQKSEIRFHLSRNVEIICSSGGGTRFLPPGERGLRKASSSTFQALRSQEKLPWLVPTYFSVSNSSSAFLFRTFAR